MSAAKPYRNYTLSVGLVNVPISIDPLFKDKEIKGHFVCSEHHKRIKMPRLCEDCGSESCQHVVTAYERNEAFVFVDAPVVESSKVISIESFALEAEIDPIFYDSTYVIYPQKKSDPRAFLLIQESLRRKKRAAVAKITIQREKVAVIRWSDYQDCLVMHTLKWQSELNLENAGIAAERTQAVKIVPQEQKFADQIVTETYAGPLNLWEYRDEYTEQLAALIDGETVEAPKPKAVEELPDIADALKRMVEGKK